MICRSIFVCRRFRPVCLHVKNLTLQNPTNSWQTLGIFFFNGHVTNKQQRKRKHSRVPAVTWSLTTPKAQQLSHDLLLIWQMYHDSLIIVDNELYGAAEFLCQPKILLVGGLFSNWWETYKSHDQRRTRSYAIQGKRRWVNVFWPQDNTFFETVQT